MADDPPTNKRPMEFSVEGQPPSKQKSCESFTSNEQSSLEIDHGLEDNLDSSGNNGGSEDCGNDEKFQHETESEKKQVVNKIQPEDKCSNGNVFLAEIEPVPPPGPIQFTSVQPDSISLVWGPPEGWSDCQNFKVTWESGGPSNSQDVTSSKAYIRDLSPGEKYEFKVVTLGKDNQQSKCVSATTHTEIPAPEELKVKKDKGLVVVTWRKPERLDQVEYVLSLWKEGKEGDEDECLRTITATSEECPLPDLDLNMMYIAKVFIVLKNGYQGKAATCHICRVPAPEQLKVVSVTPTSVHLTWSPPHGMEKTPHSYQISYQSGGSEPQIISRESCSADITGLKPYINYSLSVCTVCTKLKDGEMSEPAKKEVRTAVPAPEQLKVASVTPTSANLTWTPPHGMDQTPESYQISYHDGRSESKPFSRHSCSTIIESLEPCSDYVVSVCAKLMDGAMSEPAKQMIHTAVSVPEQLKVASVTPTSVHLTWSPPHGMEKTPHSYQISYQSGGSEPQIISRESCSADITGLKPYINYSLSVCTVCTKLKDGEMSEPAKKKVCTAVPAPEQLKVASVTPTSANLTWTPPHGMDQTPESYQISYHDGRSESKPFSRYSCSTIIESLEPCSDYVVSVCAKLKDGAMSEPAKQVVHTAVPAPEQLIEDSVTPTSAKLTWSPPHEMEQTLYFYQISYHSEGTDSQTISTEKCSADITGLKPCTSYTVSVRVKLKDGQMSEAVGTMVHTVTPVPKKLKVASVTPTSAKLTWSPPHGMEQTHYQISYQSGGTESEPFSTDSCKAVIKGLKPYTNYSVTVCTKPKDWRMSEPAKTEVHTAVPAPEQLTGDSLAPTSINLTWSPPPGMDQTPEPYQISYHSRWTEPLTISTDSCNAVITGLKPDTNYTISVCAKPKDGRMSESVKTNVHTEILTMKFYTIVIGNTQKHHQALKGMLISEGLKEVKNVESCDLILAFCVIVSRVGTDMEAALKEIPDSKPAVLAVMHHTFDPDHVTPDTSRFVKGRKIKVVDILFHEDKGILRCPRNTEAENKMLEMVWACSEPGRSKDLLPTRQARLPPPTPHTKTDAPKNSSSNLLPSQHGSSSGKSLGHKLESKESTKKAIGSSASSTEVKYSAIVSGNTLGADKEVQKRLADKGVLPKEESSVAQCDFLLVFCSVVSSVGSDIEKALKHIPDDKPSILVVMHHTFNTDHLPPDTRRYAKRSNMLIVDCLFYEDTGLLKCQRNDEAFGHISKWLHIMFPNFVEKSCQNGSWSFSTGGSLFSSFLGISWSSNKKE
ncbi:tenascin-N-like isoform X2 [Alosa pseudoharengus]|uniref:tenascin-N-like isoform X2 n=1 Tax=Alosa pseudoharengus TaxID=34774 RepID=UPI003F8A42C7